MNYNSFLLKLLPTTDYTVYVQSLVTIPAQLLTYSTYLLRAHIQTKHLLPRKTKLMLRSNIHNGVNNNGSIHRAPKAMTLLIWLHTCKLYQFVTTVPEVGAYMRGMQHNLRGCRDGAICQPRKPPNYTTHSQCTLIVVSTDILVRVAITSSCMTFPIIQSLHFIPFSSLEVILLLKQEKERDMASVSWRGRVQ